MIQTKLISLAVKVCSTTSRTSFQWEKTRIMASGFVEPFDSILLATATIYEIPNFVMYEKNPQTINHTAFSDKKILDPQSTCWVNI